MFRRIFSVPNLRIFNYFVSKSPTVRKFQCIHLCSLPFLGFKFVQCDKSPHNFNFDPNTLEHEFFIKQACTQNVNSASQLLTVTIVAIQDTSQRLRESLSKEICLIRQVLEWGDEATSDEHFEAIIQVRGEILDLRHNLQVLVGYMEYAERMSTLSAEIAYLTGNIGVSDMMCERIDQVGRAYRAEVQQNESLNMESLALQQNAIESTKMKEIFESEKEKNVEQAA